MREIRHETKKKKGMFIIDEGGERIAEIDFFANAPGDMTIYHTEVDEKHRGKGVGRDLVAGAVEHARKHTLRIIPKCQFAASVIAQTPEWWDVAEMRTGQ